MLFLVTYGQDCSGDKPKGMVYVQAAHHDGVEGIFSQFFPDEAIAGSFKLQGSESLTPANSYKAFAVYYYKIDTPTVMEHKVVIGSWDAVALIVGGVVIAEKLRMFGVRRLSA